MRKFAMLGILIGLSFTAAGCIMVLGVDTPVTDVSCHKKIVEIDNELYLLDLKTNRIHKVDKHGLVHSETTVTTETKDDD